MRRPKNLPPGVEVVDLGLFPGKKGRRIPGLMARKPAQCFLPEGTTYHSIGTARDWKNPSLPAWSATTHGVTFLLNINLRIVAVSVRNPEAKVQVLHPLVSPGKEI